jgi:hypothetical protein
MPVPDRTGGLRVPTGLRTCRPAGLLRRPGRRLRCVKPFLTRDVGCDEIGLRHLARIASPRKAFQARQAPTTRDVRHSEGNYGGYIEDLKRRKGPDADQPHRVQYRKLVRA